MSYILDALKKADAERERGTVPGLLSQPQAPALGDDDDGDEKTRRIPQAVWIGAGVVAVGVIGLLSWKLLTREEPAQLASADRAVSDQQPATTAPNAQPAMNNGMQAPPQQDAGSMAPPPRVNEEMHAGASHGTGTTMPPPRNARIDNAPAGRQPMPPTPLQAPMQSYPQSQTPPQAPATTRWSQPENTAPTSQPVEPPRAPASPRTDSMGNATPAASPQPAQSTKTAPASPTANTAPDAQRIPSLSELPDNVRREIPQLTIGGAMYSDTPSNRMLIINSQVFHEGEQPYQGLVLQEIRLKSAVFAYRGYRYSINY